MTTNNYLRALIRETILSEEGDPSKITVGDVKSALEYAKGKDRKTVAAEIAKKTGMLGVKTLLSLIPGGSMAATALEYGAEMKDFWDTSQSVKPTEKKSNPLWDLMTIDPESSAIVDDAVEKSFIADMGEKIQQLPDESLLPNVDTQLSNYLKSKYNNTHVAKE